MSLPIGQRFTVNGQTYVLRKATKPTPAEQAAILAQQAACPHDKGVHFTAPLTCRLCGKEMP